MFIIETTTTRHLLQSKEMSDTECPACGKKSHLTLRYYQIEENGITHTRKQTLEAVCECLVCGADIPLEKWSEPLKQDYARANSKLKRETFTKIGKGGKFLLSVIGVCLVFLATIVAFDKVGLLKKFTWKGKAEQAFGNTEQFLANPQVGDIALTLANDQDAKGAPLMHFSWYKIATIEGNDVTLYPHEKTVSDLPRGDWADAGMTDSGFQKDRALRLKLSDYKNKMIQTPSASPQSVMVYHVQRP